MEHITDIQPLTELIGKTIQTAKICKNNTYDCVKITFTDGTTIDILEEGQSGWISVTLGEVVVADSFVIDHQPIA